MSRQGGCAFASRDATVPSDSSLVKFELTWPQLDSARLGKRLQGKLSTSKLPSHCLCQGDTSGAVIWPVRIVDEVDLFHKLPHVEDFSWAAKEYQHARVPKVGIRVPPVSRCQVLSIVSCLARFTRNNLFIFAVKCQIHVAVKCQIASFRFDYTHPVKWTKAWDTFSSSIGLLIGLEVHIGLHCLFF